MCQVFINGVFDGYMGAITKISADSGRSSESVEEEFFNICMPGEVQIGQLIDVTSKYLQKKPEERHEGAGAIVLVSAMEAWPCG